MFKNSISGNKTAAVRSTGDQNIVLDTWYMTVQCMRLRVVSFVRSPLWFAGLDILGLHQGRAATEPGGGRGHDRQQRGPLAPTLSPLHQPKVREYTVKKGYRHSRPQPGCHNSPWPGIFKLFQPRESLVSDISAGDGNVANFFLQCTTAICTISTYAFSRFHRGLLEAQFK